MQNYHIPISPHSTAKTAQNKESKEPQYNNARTAYIVYSICTPSSGLLHKAYRPVRSGSIKKFRKLIPDSTLVISPADSTVRSHQQHHRYCRDGILLGYRPFKIHYQAKSNIEHLLKTSSPCLLFEKTTGNFCTFAPFITYI